MRFGQSQSFRQSIKQEQTLSVEQCLQQTLMLLQEMNDAAEDLLTKGRNPPAEIINQAIQTTLSSITDEPLRKALDLALSDPILRDRMLQTPEQLAIPDVRRIKRAVLDYYYELARMQGGFTFNVLDAEGKDTGHSETYNVQKRFYDSAFAYAKDPETKNPKSLESEIKAHTELARSMNAADSQFDIDGLVAEITERGQALTIRANWEGAVNTHSTLLLRALCAKSHEGEPLLGSVIRDLAVMRKLRFAVSDRLQNRFASYCESISKQDTAQNRVNGFSNIIGEYVLMSMGIISPAIFDLKRSQVDPREYLLAKEACAKEGMDLDKLMQHYQLSTCGTIFWNRYAIIGKNPDRITDEALRSFITETVRKYDCEIAEAANLDGLLNEIQEIKERYPKQDTASRATRAVEFKSLFVKILTSEAVSSLLLSHIRGDWYEKLDIFYEKAQTLSEVTRARAVGE